MRLSVERESGSVFLAIREIGGKALTIKMTPAGSNVISALLSQAADASEDFAGSECTIRGEMSSQDEKSSPIP